jgi:phage baseplate assembly protein W
MAQRIANKFPLDTQARKAIGVAIPFTNGAVFTSNYTTKEQIKANLVNYLLTNKGERIMQPNYGANLREIIFEQLTNQTSDFLKKRIQDGISQNFPQVIVNEIFIVNHNDENLIQVTITYNVANFGISDEINLTFN